MFAPDQDSDTPPADTAPPRQTLEELHAAYDAAFNAWTADGKETHYAAHHPATTRSVMKHTGLSESVVRHRAMALFNGKYLHLANPTQGQIPESYQMRAKGWTLVKGAPPYGWEEGNLV